MALTKIKSNMVAPVTATGGTTARKIEDRLADVVNVRDFGAKGDGIADDTAAIQAAITAAEQRVGAASYWGDVVSAVYLPPGHYVAAGLTISKRIAFYGAAQGTVTIRNVSNTATAPIITVNAPAYDAANTAPIHFSSPMLRGFTIDGLGSAQYGIKFPDAPYPFSTYGAVSGFLENVNIINCDLGSLFIGANRNAGRVTSCLFLHSNGAGITNYGYDWIFVNNEVGEHKTCLSVQAGGSCDVVSCNLYFATEQVVNISPYANGAYRFFGGAIEVANLDVIYIDGGGLKTNMHGFYGVRIAHAGYNGTGGTHSYFKLVNVKGLVIDGVYVSDTATDAPKPKYFIDADSNCANLHDHFVYDTGGTVWATDYTNNYGACTRGGIAFAGSTIAPKGPNPITLAPNGLQPVHFQSRNAGAFGASFVLDPASGYQSWEIGNVNGDLDFATAGSGKLRIGAHTANADAPITGYILVKDTAGNLRKLAVIA